MVVLEKNPLTVRPSELQSIKVHSTWLDGQKRFAA
jgi:predicted amidohydrolase YtcJ